MRGRVGFSCGEVEEPRLSLTGIEMLALVEAGLDVQGGFVQEPDRVCHPCNIARPAVDLDGIALVQRS